MEWNRIEAKWFEMARRLQNAAPAPRTLSETAPDALTRPAAKPAPKAAVKLDESGNARAMT